MAKEELITFEGEVVEILPDARFRVKLEGRLIFRHKDAGAGVPRPGTPRRPPVRRR